MFRKEYKLMIFYQHSAENSIFSELVIFKRYLKQTIVHKMLLVNNCQVVHSLVSYFAHAAFWYFL